MSRVKFRKGEQRKFLEKVLININCPSLRELINRGFDIPYSTLKNYYSEERFLPSDFFEKLCFISGINVSELDVFYLDDNFGQVFGGKKSKKRK